MRISKSLVGALTALIATAAVAAPRSAPPMNLDTDDCSALPSAQSLALYYPGRASRMGVGGSVILQCHVGDDLTLQACAVLSETPTDWDFGQAAMKLSTLFRMKPVSRDGLRTAGRVIRIPFRFLPPPPPLDGPPFQIPPAS